MPHLTRKQVSSGAEGAAGSVRSPMLHTACFQLATWWQMSLSPSTSAPSISLFNNLVQHFNIMHTVISPLPLPPSPRISRPWALKVYKMVALCMPSAVHITQPRAWGAALLSKAWGKAAGHSETQSYLFTFVARALLPPLLFSLGVCGSKAPWIFVGSGLTLHEEVSVHSYAEKTISHSY